MDKPNILILLTDQQHHRMLSCAGNRDLRTPALDRLAADGARLARCYATDPVCIPARFSLFTGRMPSAIGMRGNGGSGLAPFSVEDDHAGLGWLLRAAGYRTLYGGKEHFPVGLTAERLGFEMYCRDERESLARTAAEQVRALAGSPGPWALVASFINPHDICYQALRAFADGPSERAVVEQGAIECATLDRVLATAPCGLDGLPALPANFRPQRDEPEFIERTLASFTDNPYDRALVERGAVECATLDRALAAAPAGLDGLPALPANHQPQRDEPELVERTLAARGFKLRARREWDERAWRLHRWAYARLTEAVDAQIGQVLDALDASGAAGSTLVLMTSDHGDHDGAHRLEHKTFFYDESARVPFLARLPGAIPAGLVAPVPASGLDLVPTVCDWAGAALPGHCRGRSLRGLLSGGRLDRDLVYGENVVSRMVCGERWKYVRYDGGADAEQLYDLAADPGETGNHAADPANAGVLEAMRVRLDACMAEHAALALPRLPLRPGADPGVPGE